jgi:hypothetical protein
VLGIDRSQREFPSHVEESLMQPSKLIGRLHVVTGTSCRRPKDLRSSACVCTGARPRSAARIRLESCVGGAVVLKGGTRVACGGQASELNSSPVFSGVSGATTT